MGVEREYLTSAVAVHGVPLAVLCVNLAVSCSWAVSLASSSKIRGGGGTMIGERTLEAVLPVCVEVRARLVGASEGRGRHCWMYGWSGWCM